MRVTPYSGSVEIKYLDQVLSDKDIERLKYDTEYNIRIGARILYDKWRSGFAALPAIPKVSDMNPQILDNWYFAVMAYNVYAVQNLPKDIWGQVYQEQVFSFIIGFNKANFSKDKIYAHGLEADGLPVRSKIYTLTGNTMKSSGTGFEIKIGDIMIRTYRLINNNSTIEQTGTLNYQDAAEVSGWAKADVSLLKGLNVMTGIIKDGKLYFMPR